MPRFHREDQGRTPAACRQESLQNLRRPLQFPGERPRGASGLREITTCRSSDQRYQSLLFRQGRAPDPPLSEAQSDKRQSETYLPKLAAGSSAMTGTGTFNGVNACGGQFCRAPTPRRSSRRRNSVRKSSPPASRLFFPLQGKQGKEAEQRCNYPRLPPEGGVDILEEFLRLFFHTRVVPKPLRSSPIRPRHRSSAGGRPPRRYASGRACGDHPGTSASR